MGRKEEEKKIYILEALRKNHFCSDWDDFERGVKKFLLSPSCREVKKVIGAFKTTNDPRFKEFEGDEITPHIFKKVAEFMRNNFTHDEVFTMKFEELHGPNSEN
ncbi:MAG: hypothetical protein A2271_01740 [Candidatus Moranbacteria bacterium RIFOXYA12_FULL_35_19]|nr:MAG: hypothetical protein UR78_C0016G0009 [Candidatus Moranbacteria bacterium GW2011_GWF2_35_39]OGI32410.1 MAG: hypothetical protein A2489_02200 [Candidatus Moranbacteria bacterium RIFOXYC12_FULL_36_13]OGI33104.1 MAG: hypothetical protein A2343_02735 [Candidatus Moranbacteria bacterium RIFOXYB12_FULL_35_8]OGI35494.1 MAG: hypothetical protein A2271_01740 [Candidatus Moranbacteria bacterium RIFOXYA12_FULL_35_19]